jgi:drug/metabolite transporter (DMT)-like permease
LTLLIRKSWVVFIYAITISIESILIEFLTTTFLQIPPILISAISITLAGVMLLLTAAFLMKKKGISTLFSKSWKNLLLACLSLAVGVFTWYDSISRIGASKEVLIAGPLEIVVLAQIFLNEKLDRIQVIGIVLALMGFFMAIASDAGNVLDDSMKTDVIIYSSVSIITITFGDIEAIVSAFGFAIGVLFLTKLVSIHSSIEVAGSSMLVAGLILAGFMVGFLHDPLDISSSDGVVSFQQQQQPSTVTIILLILFSLIPFIGSLCYSTGLSRIGASITATIGSSSILITVLIQIMLKELGIASNLPENIFLAILGGVLGFLGIYVIHMHNSNNYLPINIRKKQ